MGELWPAVGTEDHQEAEEGPRCEMMQGPVRIFVTGWEEKMLYKEARAQAGGGIMATQWGGAGIC